jgi:hypothetical protein
VVPDGSLACDLELVSDHNTFPALARKLLDVKDLERRLRAFYVKPRAHRRHTTVWRRRCTGVVTQWLRSDLRFFVTASTLPRRFRNRVFLTLPARASWTIGIARNPFPRIPKRNLGTV